MANQNQIQPCPEIARIGAAEASIGWLNNFRQNTAPRLDALEGLEAGGRLGTLEDLNAGPRLTELETYKNNATHQLNALQHAVGDQGPLNVRLDGLHASVADANGRLRTVQGSLNALGNAGERLTTLEDIQSNVRLQALEGSRDTFDTFRNDANGRLKTLEDLNAGDRLGVLNAFRGNAHGRLNTLEAVRAGERLGNLEALNPRERFIDLQNFKQNATGRLTSLENVHAGTRLGELEDFRQTAVPLLNNVPTFLTQANGRLGALETGKVNVQDYQKDQAAITGRIDAIETITGNLRDTYEKEIPQLRNRITGVEKHVDGLDQDITQIQVQIHKNHNDLTHRMDKQEKNLSTGIKSLQESQEACCQTMKGMFEKINTKIKKNGRNERAEPSGGGNTSVRGAMGPYAQLGSGINFNNNIGGNIAGIGGNAGNWFHSPFYGGNNHTSSHVPSDPPSLIAVLPARRAYVFRSASLSPSPPSSLSRRHRSPHGYYHRRSSSSLGAYANYNAPSIQIGLQRESGRGLFSKAKKDNFHIAVGGGRGAGGAGGRRRHSSWIGV